MTKQPTVVEIEKLARAVTRAKLLHPGYRGRGDAITFDAADASWATEPITLNAVGSVRHVYNLTIRVSVNAEQASRLPGFPGTTHEDEVDPPITGLDLLLGEAQLAAQNAAGWVFSGSPLAADVEVGPGPNGGVTFSRVTVESADDRLF